MKGAATLQLGWQGMPGKLLPVIVRLSRLISIFRRAGEMSLKFVFEYQRDLLKFISLHGENPPKLSWGGRWLNCNPETNEKFACVCVDTRTHEIVGLILTHEAAHYCLHTHGHTVPTNAGNTEEDHT